MMKIKDYRNRKRNCLLCEKEISIYTEVKGSNSSKWTVTLSDEGVCYENKWFCNQCWKKMVDNVLYNLKVSCNFELPRININTKEKLAKLKEFLENFDK